MEVTHPGFRAPIRKGDRIRISATYENKDHAWYSVMEHLGIYVDEQQPPRGQVHEEGHRRARHGRRRRPRRRTETKRKRTCRKVKRQGQRRKRRTKCTTQARPHEGARARSRRCRSTRRRASSTGRGASTPTRCAGPKWGRPCELPVNGEPKKVPAQQVTIANFAYQPGNRTAGSSAPGEIATIKQGQSLAFVNADQPANIRHTVTTCPWPCNGPYVGNYPLADGRWDSEHARLRRDRRRQPEPASRETPKTWRRAGTRTSAASTRGCAAPSRWNSNVASALAARELARRR